jgi:hypothetical protein
MSSGAGTKVGIGFCDSEDAFRSGVVVAGEAIRSGGIERPDFVYAFCGGKLDHEAYFAGLRQVIGADVPIVGGSAVGIVTNDRICYQGNPAGAAVIQTDRIAHRIAAVGSLHEGEESAGRSLAERLSPGPDDKLVFLFYEWVRRAGRDGMPPVLNSASPLLGGMGQITDCRAPLVGAGLLGSYRLGTGNQFCGSYVGEQHAVGVALSGDFSAYSRITHGCTPVDGVYHRITKMGGSSVYELDGRPILDIIDDLFGHRDWRATKPVDYLTLGVNYGEKYGEPREDHYVNRLILGALPDESGVTVFDSDFEEGMEIQFMLRETRKMLESAKKNSVELMETILGEGKRPVFAMYIDCAVRTMQYSCSTAEESAEVQKACNHYGVPLLGFFSGVEIAPLLATSRGLDWTGVLVAVAEDM